jgi:hypothetical protein
MQQRRFGSGVTTMLRYFQVVWSILSVPDLEASGERVESLVVENLVGQRAACQTYRLDHYDRQNSRAIAPGKPEPPTAIVSRH